jgi:fatty acid desaturase
MADLERTGGRRPSSRRRREQRAYRLTLATGGLATVGVVGFVLALVNIVGWGLPILAVILAGVCGLLLRRTLGV